jgi:hypothetical protein
VATLADLLRVQAEWESAQKRDRERWGYWFREGPDGLAFACGKHRGRSLEAVAARGGDPDYLMYLVRSHRTRFDKPMPDAVEDAMRRALGMPPRSDGEARPVHDGPAPWEVDTENCIEAPSGPVAPVSADAAIPTCPAAATPPQATGEAIAPGRRGVLAGPPRIGSAEDARGLMAVLAAAAADMVAKAAGDLPPGVLAALLPRLGGVPVAEWRAMRDERNALAAEIEAARAEAPAAAPVALTPPAPAPALRLGAWLAPGPDGRGLVMQRGKHSGERLDGVPEGYLRWLLGCANLSPAERLAVLVAAGEIEAAPPRVGDRLSVGARAAGGERWVPFCLGDEAGWVHEDVARLVLAEYGRLAGLLGTRQASPVLEAMAALSAATPADSLR